MWRGLFFSLCIIGVLGGSLGVSAQVLHQDVQERVSAEVLEIVSEYDRAIAGTTATATVQDVRAVLKSSERVGEVVYFESELVLLKPGDKIFLFWTQTITGQEYFTYADFERRTPLLIVSLLFIGMLVLFAGWQGARALLSLLVSVAAIVFVLVPALLAGYDPVLVSVGIAGVILAVVLFGTHGFTPRAWMAFVGTFSAVVITGVIAVISVNAMRLTGFSSDAAVYLNFATDGLLDLSGLLLGSIIIGILGVLDDVSITQASVVQELKGANPTLQFGQLYRRAIRVGRDHIGSLVNTLALAYVGVSLPLILLYSKTQSSIWVTLNQEVIAAELLRIIVGSIGLVLAVPLTTAVAAWYWQHRIVDENEELSHCGHHHH